MPAMYGFDAATLEDLTQTLSEALGVPLYRQLSPMHGELYTISCSTRPVVRDEDHGAIAGVAIRPPAVAQDGNDG